MGVVRMKLVGLVGRVSICALILVSSSAFASSLCKTKWSDFQKKLNDSNNRLAFVNQPGPMGIGMCWWHSRTQRNSNYLLEFQAQAARPDANQAWQIIKGLSRTDTVQAVPGFSNLSDFSSVYSSEINESMGQWQMADSFLKFGWSEGLGASEANADSLSQEMDSLYESVVLRKNVVYQMLKMPGVVAHAWLVLNMIKLPANQGYQLAVVDSNAASVQYYMYSRGMTKLNYAINGFGYSDMSFTPNTQRDSELSDYQGAIKAACGR